MKLILLLLLTSCGTMNSNIISSKRVTTYKIGVSCPNGYYYSFESELCHYKTVKPVLTAFIPKKVQTKPKSTKTARPPINCVKVLNQCGVSL